MIFLRTLMDWLLDLDTRKDLLADIRTISISVVVIGGVSRFFGFHNTHYVTIVSCLTWAITSFMIYLLKEDK